ncbi:MAG: adenosylcobalamin-dependent ribonucleoside-diphosphate reductase [Calothrix sp. SM1_5_4]|nr:adenosylcobalamin-dependent ribonucleoside-diphosphate reductase [Calothrix sp. SM1_5_4]
MRSARVFEAELSYILLHQIASFNSPVYFNVGVFPSYGTLGTSENFVYDPAAGRARALTSAYLHPQASACFIQDVRDDLMSIFDLLKNEAKLFKYGSGTGTNFSRLRAKGEPLDAGGESTGLLSYLEIFDKAAHAIKSGGTTRRAAKMVVLDADHPEIVEFVRWKMNEERKARVLIAAGISGGMDGEAFRTVSGQNSNNSVRVTDEFMGKVAGNDAWGLRARRTGEVVRWLGAGDLLREMARAAWDCADPGLQFHDTIQRWHVCPEAGEIRSSNPCSEFMFLDDTACNLASLNLVAFRRPGGGGFDWPAFRQTVRIMLLAQEILVDYASYPSAAIAENSHRFRPLGLGYANLGGFLMREGVAYESDEAALWTGRLTSAMHALALEMSQEIAAVHGSSVRGARVQEVLERHALAAEESVDLPWVRESLRTTLAKSSRTGLRHAQVTLIAPTGTIGLLMDCDTLGIEPDFALIKRKHMSGGGELVLMNGSVGEGLKSLGYDASSVESIMAYVN